MNKMFKIVYLTGHLGKKCIIYYGFLKLNFYLKTTQGKKQKNLKVVRVIIFPHVILSRIAGDTALYCFLHFQKPKSIQNLTASR